MLTIVNKFESRNLGRVTYHRLLTNIGALYVPNVPIHRVTSITRTLGTRLALHRNEIASAWERDWLCMGTRLALHRNEIGSAWERDCLCMGTRLALHGNEIGSAWERDCLCMGTRLPLHGNEIASAWERDWLWKRDWLWGRKCRMAHGAWQKIG